MIDLNIFLQVLFRYCNESDIPCAFARSYSLFDLSNDHRDIDILLKKNDIEKLIRFIHAWPDIKLVSIIKTRNTTQLYLYGIKQKVSPFLCLDIHHTLALDGLSYLNLNAVLLRKEPVENAPYFQPCLLDLAFIYLFTHILKHKTISAMTRQIIIQAMKNERMAFSSSISLYFGNAGIKLLEKTLDENDLAAMSRLRRLFINQQRKADMMPVYSAILFEKMQIVFGRLFGRHDLRLVIMGTDGAGKTTLARKLIQRLHYLRPTILHAHLLPVLPGQKEPDSNKINNDPHGLPRRHWLTSNIKLLYYGFLYALDALLPRRGSRLIIYDRYLTDILVDPQRFRFGGSMRLARFIIKCIPSIDFYIWVSTPPSIAYGRKPEVALPVMIEQYEAYKKLSDSLENTTVFTISDDLEALITTISSSLEKQCRQ
jgi:hypothetical protein